MSATIGKLAGRSEMREQTDEEKRDADAFFAAQFAMNDTLAEWNTKLDAVDLRNAMAFFKSKNFSKELLLEIQKLTAERDNLRTQFQIELEKAWREGFTSGRDGYCDQKTWQASQASKVVEGLALDTPA